MSREDLDKAIGHGLAHAPVRGIMSSQVRDGRGGRDARRAPRARHVRRGRARRRRPRGAPRRGRQPRRPPAGARGRGAAVETQRARPSPTSSRANERLRRDRDAVARLGDRADGVYLVGGTVRDILLGEESFDVDIAVEGDAIAFAYALAEALDGRATPHRRFGTAVVSYGDGERVDVVTTRTEFYDAPGALPTVERAGLREDLFRRDFTINAMAASLARGSRPARRPVRRPGDLDARVLRVLHNLSFIDDPTRIFRGIRYEARYGFRFEEHSARLLTGCIEMGLVGDLSSSRLRDELTALLEDPGAPDGIRRLGELGADRAIHPHLAATTTLRRSSRERSASSRDELGVDVPTWRIGIAALARELTSDEAYDWLERLTVRRRDAERIVGADHGRAADRRAARARDARAGRRSSLSRTRSRPTRRSSRSRSRIAPSSATTSSAARRAASRSAGRT